MLLNAAGITAASIVAGLSTMTLVGCYDSSVGLTLNSTYQFNSQGYCQLQCVAIDALVLGLTEETKCYCGNEFPPSNTLVNSTFCDAGCAGFGTDPCGSVDGQYFTVYTTGEVDEADINNATTSTSASGTTSGSASSTSAGAVSVTTIGTSVVTVTAAPESGSSSSAHGSNTTGIIVGVVIGVIIIAAIAGGIFFWMRRKNRLQLKEAYERNAAINNFVAAGKPPTSSAGFSTTDTRLDPSAMSRRLSDGSIADNEDYSRKILRVTNA